MPEAVMNTDLPLGNKRTGKVRDLYDMPLADGGDGKIWMSKVEELESY